MLRQMWIAIVLCAAPVAAEPTLAEGQALLQSKDFKGAAAVFEKIAEREPTNATAWFLLGYAYHAAGDLDRAVPAHRRAAESPQGPPAAMYNLACALALQGKKEEAFSWLEKAVAAGTPNLRGSRRDPDLASLRDDPRFDRLLTPAPAPPPATAGPREFDFWVGDWDVRTRSRTQTGWVDAGRLAIRVFSILDGAAMIEFAEGSFGGGRTLGFSVRAFDPRQKRWNLVLNWPSPNNPTFSTLSGNFRHGRGEFFGPSGGTRYTFSDIAPTRLRWDQATTANGGANWSSNLIFEFTRRDPKLGPMEHGPARTRARVRGLRFRDFDFMVGTWRGTRTVGADTVAVTMRSYVILEGAAIVEFTDAGDEKSFSVRAYDPGRKAWVRYSVEKDDPVFERVQGTPAAMENTTTRVTWTARNDLVERTRMQSNDGGKTWTTGWTERLERD